MLITTTDIAYIIQQLDKLKTKPSNTLLADAATAYFSDINRLLPAYDKFSTKQRIEQLLQRIDKNYAEYLKLEDTPKNQVAKAQKLAKTCFLIYGMMAVYGCVKKVWQHQQTAKKPNPLYAEMACPAGAKIYQFCGVEADPTNCVIASKLATEAIQFCTSNQPSAIRRKNAITNLIDTDIALSVIISEFSKIQRFELSEFDAVVDKLKREMYNDEFERDYKYGQMYDFHSKKNVVLMVNLCGGSVCNFDKTRRYVDDVFDNVFFAPNEDYIRALECYQPFEEDFNFQAASILLKDDKIPTFVDFNPNPYKPPFLT